jgi:RNA polymerase sigma factor (sigma-70 family)
MSRHASPVLRFLRGVAPPADATDAELLSRFVRQRDEAAFSTLLHRHGPVVLGACRRVLHNEHDAEDAFQATFLVLARKAHAVEKPELLGNWLYGVACRIALKARGKIARRRVKETQAVRPLLESTQSEAVWADLRPVLDEEVNRLPDCYRLPFVLCYLQGKTNEEAAHLLGCPKGTILSRLATAREKLRTRLVRRGITLSAGLLAAVLAEGVAGAVVPPSLLGPTVKAAQSRVAGGTAAGLVPVRVVKWAEGVVRAMMLSKVKVAALVMVLVAILIGFGIVVHRASGATDPEPAREPERKATADVPPKEKTENSPRIKNARLMDVLVDVDPEKRTITFVTGVKEELFEYVGPIEERQKQIKEKVDKDTTKQEVARVDAKAELYLSFRQSPSVANSVRRQLEEFVKCKWLFSTIEVTGEGDELIVRKMTVWR